MAVVACSGVEAFVVLRSLGMLSKPNLLGSIEASVLEPLCSVSTKSC